MGSFPENRCKFDDYFSSFIKLNNIYPCWFPCNKLRAELSAEYQENTQSLMCSATQGTHPAYSEKAPQRTSTTPGLRGPSSNGSGRRHDNNGREYLSIPAPNYKRQEILIGIKVPRIPTDFPMVDLQEATRKIKHSQPLTVDSQSTNSGW